MEGGDNAHNGIWKLMRGGGRRSREEEENTGYIGIRFDVPADNGDDFEKEWSRMLKNTVDNVNVDKMALYKTRFDSNTYWSFAEFETMRDFRDHMDSKDFEDFSDFVDDNDISWRLYFLDSESEKIEDEQEKSMGKKNRRGESKSYTHVLTHYYVPPGEDDKFIDAWTDTAYKTIDEKNNYMYHLRRDLGANTHFMTCGTWDKMTDFIDHFESRHLGKLHDYTADKDIYWWHEILEHVYSQEEYEGK